MRAAFHPAHWVPAFLAKSFFLKINLCLSVSHAVFEIRSSQCYIVVSFFLSKSKGMGIVSINKHAME